MSILVMYFNSVVIVLKKKKANKHFETFFKKGGIRTVLMVPPLLPALRNQREADLCMFRVSLVCR